MSATINRRSMLRGLAAATAIPAVPAIASQNTDADIIALAAEHAKAEHAVKAAADAVEWIVAEYRHLWPLAPDAITLMNASDWHENAERDIAGRRLTRDGEKLPRVVRTSDSLRACLDRLDGTPLPKNASATRIARREKAASIFNSELALASAYEAETARLREVSGIGAANRRQRECSEHLASIVGRIINAPVTTPEGLAIKARIGLATAFVGMVDRDEGCPVAMRFAAIIARDIVAVHAPS